MPAVLIYAVASMATIWASLNQETREDRFHAVFIYHIKSQEPLEAVDPNYFSGRPGSISWQPLPSWLVHRNPSLSKAHGGGLYLHVLLGMVLQLLFTRFRSTWAVDFALINVPHVRGTMLYWDPQPDAPASSFVKWDECEWWFPESGVFRAWVPPLVERMAVPLKTTVWGETRYGGDRQPLGWSLHFKNPFVKITISIVWKAGSHGIGSLRKLIGYSLPYSEEFQTQTYAITLLAQFRPYRSGHSQMVRYRKWVDDMFKALKEELDSQRHWEQQKEHYTMFPGEKNTPREPQNVTQTTRG